MDIIIHLRDESSRKLAYIQQQTSQEAEAAINCAVENAIDTYYQQLQSHPDPLAQLRQSRFIGCFSGDRDLAANSEIIFQQMMNEKQ